VVKSKTEKGADTMDGKGETARRVLKITVEKGGKVLKGGGGKKKREL